MSNQTLTRAELEERIKIQFPNVYGNYPEAVKYYLDLRLAFELDKNNYELKRKIEYCDKAFVSSEWYYDNRSETRLIDLEIKRAVQNLTDEELEEYHLLYGQFRESLSDMLETSRERDLPPREELFDRPDYQNGLPDRDVYHGEIATK